MFDCGASFQGASLNSVLLSGPDLTSSLVSVLARFRLEPVAMMADIESMFYQVRVHPENCDVLGFLWWPEANINNSLEEYVPLGGSPWGLIVTMKTGGFSCGKKEFITEVIHSEKLNGAFRRTEAELP